MQTRPTRIAISILVPILMVTATALAQPTDFAPPAPGTPDLKLQKMQLLLDLTPDQLDRISQIQAQQRAQREQLRDQSHRLRRELDTLQQAEYFDTQRARDLAHQQAELRVSRMAQRHAAREQVEEILTPEQLAKQASYRELRRAQREQHRTWQPRHRRGAP